MEKFFLNKLALAAFCFLAFSCGKSTEEEETSGGVDDVYLLSNQLKKVDKDGVEGTGVARFSRTLPSGLSSEAISLRIQLPNAGSSFSIVYFSSRPSDLADGLHVTFTRAGSQVAITVDNSDGHGPRTMTVNTVNLDPNNFELTVDCHGYADKFVAGLYVFQDPTPSPLAHSNSVSPPLSIAAPGGILKGFILNDARVMTARVRAAVDAR